MLPIIACLMLILILLLVYAFATSRSTTSNAPINKVVAYNRAHSHTHSQAHASNVISPRFYLPRSYEEVTAEVEPFASPPPTTTSPAPPQSKGRQVPSVLVGNWYYQYGALCIDDPKQAKGATSCQVGCASNNTDVSSCKTCNVSLDDYIKQFNSAAQGKVKYEENSAFYLGTGVYESSDVCTQLKSTWKMVDKDVSAPNQIINFGGWGNCGWSQSNNKNPSYCSMNKDGVVSPGYQASKSDCDGGPSCVWTTDLINLLPSGKDIRDEGYNGVSIDIEGVSQCVQNTQKGARDFGNAIIKKFADWQANDLFTILVVPGFGVTKFFPVTNAEANTICNPILTAFGSKKCKQKGHVYTCQGNAVSSEHHESFMNYDDHKYAAFETFDANDKCAAQASDARAQTMDWYNHIMKKDPSKMDFVCPMFYALINDSERNISADATAGLVYSSPICDYVSKLDAGAFAKAIREYWSGDGTGKGAKYPTPSKKVILGLSIGTQGGLKKFITPEVVQAASGGFTRWAVPGGLTKPEYRGGSLVWKNGSCVLSGGGSPGGKCCGGKDHGKSCTSGSQCDCGSCWGDISKGCVKGKCAAPAPSPSGGPSAAPGQVPSNLVKDGRLISNAKYGGCQPYCLNVSSTSKEWGQSQQKTKGSDCPKDYITTTQAFENINGFATGCMGCSDMPTCVQNVCQLKSPPTNDQLSNWDSKCTSLGGK